MNKPLLQACLNDVVVKIKIQLITGFLGTNAVLMYMLISLPVLSISAMPLF